MKRLLAVAAVLALTACGGATGGGTTTSNAVDRPAGLADHETADLVAHLTPVAGYTYVDVSAEEVENALANLHEVEQDVGVPGFFAGFSLHGVVADDPAENRSNTRTGRPEVGLLQLSTFGVAPPHGTEATATFFERTMGWTSTGGFTASGTRVFAFEDPTRPDSRYWYSWMRHGVKAAVDGADAGALERWVRRYLAEPSLSPGETTALADRLVSLPGYGFTNYDGPALVEGVAKGFGAVPHSIHKVVDGDGAFATLTLVAPGRLYTPDDAAGAFFDASGVSVTATGPRSLGGATVATYGDGSDMALYVWVADGVVGVVGTSVATKAEAFLAELFPAWATAGYSRPAVATPSMTVVTSSVPPTTSTVGTAATSVVATAPSDVGCVPPVSIETPLYEGFSEPCGTLEASSDADHTSGVVDGAYQVVVRNEAWWTWVDLEVRAKAVTVALRAALPSGTGDQPGLFTLICLGTSGVDSYRLMVGATADRAAALVIRSPQRADDVTLVSTQLDPARFAEPVAIGFSCEITGDGVALAATIDGAEVLATVDHDSSAFVPFTAIGLRFDNPAGAPVTFVLDDLAVDATSA